MEHSAKISVFLTSLRQENFIITFIGSLLDNQDQSSLLDESIFGVQIRKELN